ncbi:MAG: hypothetical protein ACOYJG_07480 [Prevotella sp.]|jgi:hypothetical protein
MSNTDYIIQRSGVACIKEAYLLFINNIKKIFLGTWKPALILSVVAGLGTLLMPPLFATTMAQVPQSQAEAISNYASTIFSPIIYLIVCTGFFMWMLSNVQTQLTGGSYKKNIKHAMAFFGIAVVLYGGIYVLYNVIAYFAGMSMVQGGMPVDKFVHWLLAGLGILLLLFIIQLPPLCHASVCGLWHTDKKPLGLFASSFWKGFRHWGFLFKIFFITGIIALLICCVVNLPTNIIVLATNADAFGQIVMGDSSGLPKSFPVLNCISTAITAFILSYMGVWLYLNYFYAACSIQAKDIAKQAAKEAAKELQQPKELPQ